MMYEMVTETPPFVGDMLSVIDQHISTIPIYTSWHRPELPPAWERLILSLLEKDPGKRPESANAVLESLRSVGVENDPVLPVQDPAIPAINPIYSRNFAGREWAHYAE